MKESLWIARYARVDRECVNFGQRLKVALQPPLVINEEGKPSSFYWFNATCRVLFLILVQVSKILNLIR